MEDIVHKLLTRIATPEETREFMDRYSNIDKRFGKTMTLHATIVYLSRYDVVKQLVDNLTDVPDRSISEKVYRLLNDHQDVPCSNGSFLKFGAARRDRNQDAGYYVFCSRNCACATASKIEKLHNQVNYSIERKQAIREKKEATTRDRYGVDSYLSLPETKKALLEKYPIGSPERAAIYDKVRKTNDERYGGMGLASPVLRERIRETNIKRYGAHHPAMNSSVSSKISNSLKQVGLETYRVRAKTMMERYGVENPSQISGHLEKVKATCRVRYGMDLYILTDEFKEQARASCQERYGVGNIKQAEIPAQTMMKLNSTDYLSFNIQHHSVASLGKELGVSRGTVRNYLLRASIDVPKRSAYERAIAKFLDDNDIEYISNSRSIIGGKELDFYLPEYKLAIEVNGLYWHSEKFRDRHYHLEKYNRCHALGIRLLMINEDEWLRNPDVILSKITNLLGKSIRGCGARKLSIREVSSGMANDFFDRHHIQGRTGSIVHAVAAYSNDEIVGMMAFNKQRGTGEIELIRFCSDGRTYAGMFSRLFRYSINQFGLTSVISFADLRYSDGGVYERNGFVLENVIKPDYRYIVGDKTFHKSSFTKSRIAERYGVDITGRTEREAMRELGILRIYDCGKMKFRWTLCWTLTTD